MWKSESLDARVQADLDAEEAKFEKILVEEGITPFAIGDSLRIT